MNPTVPECMELETRETYRVKLRDLYNLDFFDGRRGYPNYAN